MALTKVSVDLLADVTSTAAELNILDGVTSTTAELNILDGVAQINYAKEAASTSEKESRIRNQRDSWLKGSDYMALSDVTMPDVWKTYRQDLRNVPQQAGFPDNVTWPLAPEDNKVV